MDTQPTAPAPSAATPPPASPQPPMQPVSAPPPKKSTRNMLFLIICIVLIVFGIGGFITWSAMSHKPQPQPVAIATPTPTKTAEAPKKVLIPYIPDFDTLTLADLPNFRDVRGVYDVNDTVILTGIDTIAVYDPAKKAVIKTLNKELIKSVYSTAVIGNSLFVVSVPELAEKGTWVDSTPRIYQIDLTKNEIVKQYFGQKDLIDTKEKLPKLTNLSITSKGKYLYASSYDGIMRIDTTTGEIYKYPQEKVGYSGNCVTSMGTKNDTVFGLINCRSNLGMISLNDETEIWSYESLGSQGFSSYLNKQLKDVGYEIIPTFSYISRMVNGKYYLFSDKGMYSLKKNEMPVFVKDIVIDQTFDTEQERTKIIVTKDEKYAVFAGPVLCGPDPECPLMDVIGVDIPGGVASSLLKKNYIYPTLDDEQQQNLVNMVSKATVKETSTQVILTYPAKGAILTIDLPSMSVAL